MVNNAKKYIKLCNDNKLKKKSFEDNIYFTLRDIFMNAQDERICTQSNWFNSKLTNDICYNERYKTFEYSDILYEERYVEKLCIFIEKIKQNSIKYYYLDENCKYDINDYIEFDNWWKEFEVLKQLLKNHHDKIILWMEEDVDRDCERLEELSFE